MPWVPCICGRSRRRSRNRARRWGCALPTARRHLTGTPWRDLLHDSRRMTCRGAGTHDGTSWCSFGGHEAAMSSARMSMGTTRRAAPFLAKHARHDVAVVPMCVMRTLPRPNVLAPASPPRVDGLGDAGEDRLASMEAPRKARYGCAPPRSARCHLAEVMACGGVAVLLR